MRVDLIVHVVCHGGSGLRLRHVEAVCVWGQVHTEKYTCLYMHGYECIDVDVVIIRRVVEISWVRVYIYVYIKLNQQLFIVSMMHVTQL